MTSLFQKYDVPVPRYTSYPTVPYWCDSPDTAEWLTSLNRAFQQPEMTWAMYVHIPFCETLCTFCGCNTVITRNHREDWSYAESVLREWKSYLRQVPSLRERPLRQLHLGGGTPTFLSAEHLHKLVGELLSQVNLSPDQFDGSLEVDPRRTTREQLQALAELGFRRISLGVQDFDPEVQRLVNREQPFRQTQEITDISRELGYQSVNFDLIYGLPKQTTASFATTIEQTLELRPDRIALYSLALVPWIKPQQRLFKDEDLPQGSEKRELFELAYKRLLDAGYIEIGMDHFALPSDTLAEALHNKQLHRNFMGYAEMRTDVLLGLGVSSISETPDCFHQNEKVLPVYVQRVGKDEIPTLRGHKLTAGDQTQREQILQFMTQGEVSLRPGDQTQDVREFLADMIRDELVELNASHLRLTEKGRPFLRNACVALDHRLRERHPSTRIFSQAL